MHMRKLLLILVMTALVTTAWSQSKLSTIRGKTKDGKTIKVEYYQGNVEDYIESVKYQVVDELQSQVKDLQGRVKTLQGKVDDANKEIANLKKQQSNTTGSNDAELKRLRDNVAEKSAEIANLNKQIGDLQADIMELNRQLDAKKTSIDSLRSKIAEGTNKPIAVNTNDADMRRLRDSIVSKDATIKKLNASLAKCEMQVNKLEKSLREKPEPQAGVMGMPAKAPAIGLAVNLGPAFLRNSSMDDIWAKDVNLGKSFAVYFETARLADNFPLSIQAGLGIGSYKMSGRVNSYDAIVHGFEDVDGDTCTAHYAITDIKESLSLTYLNIPINFCIGQPAKDRVTGYFKLGFTPSIKIGATFAGEGKYALNADYYQWGLHLDDINHLGYGSGFDCYTDVQPEVNSFVLWGDVAFGLYVPFKGSSVLLNAGVKLDMMLMSAGKAEALDNGLSFSTNTCNLLIGGPKLFCPSVELGLVYSLK